MRKAISMAMAIALVVGSFNGMPVVEGKKLYAVGNNMESVEAEQPTETSVTDISEYKNNEIIVVYKEDKESSPIKGLQNKDENVEEITDNAVLYTLDNQQEMKEKIEELEEDNQVAYIQPNYTYNLMDTSVEDPYFSLQWALNNDGTFQYNSEYSSPLSDIDINAPEAWAVWDAGKDKQKEVIVAVIDTGIKYDHDELLDGMWVNKGEIAGNGIDDDGNGYVDDVYGWNFYSESAMVYNKRSSSEDSHGTHGAGSIIAERNSTGIAGIASNGNVKVMPVKALGGRDGSGSTEDLVRAIQYAEEMGASICNLSLGTEEEDALLGDAIKKSNMLFIAAAGNGDEWNRGYNIDSNPMYPAAYDYDNIISVANIKSDGQLSSTSNYGVKSVDLAAPGTDVFSTSTVRAGYEYMTGTSMAAPMVSAAAAMVYSHYENITLSDVKDILLNSVKEVSGMKNKVLTGGMLDVYKALTYYNKDLDAADTTIPSVTDTPVTMIPRPTQEMPTSTPKATEPADILTPEPTKEAATSTPEATEPANISTPEPTKEAVTSTPNVTKPAKTATPKPATPKPATPKPATPKPTITPVSKKITVNTPRNLLLKPTVQKNRKKAKIKLSWNKVKGANGYIIYRSTSKKGKYKKIKVITKGNIHAYINQNLSRGKRYYYKIKAYKKVYNKKVYSKYSIIRSVRIKK